MIILPRAATSGLFSILAVKPDGRMRPVAPLQKNLITNSGLNRLGVGIPVIYCSVGRSNREPDANDTAIVSFVAQHTTLRSRTYGTQSTPPYYGWQRWVFRFNPLGVANTLREIVFGWDEMGVSAWSRSLIKDEEGNPIDVAWLEDETLQVSYEVRVYPATDTDGNILDVSYSTDITYDSGVVTHSGVIRPALVTGVSNWGFCNAAQEIGRTLSSGAAGSVISPTIYNGSISSYIGTPTGDAAAGPVGSWWNSRSDYEQNSFKRVGEILIPPETGVLTGGISAMLVTTTIGTYQFSINPPIPKTEDDTLRLTLYTPTWSRKTT